MQNGTRKGVVSLTAGEDLTGKEGYLATMTSTGIQLTDGLLEDPTYIILAGAASGEKVDLVPFSFDQNHRVKVAASVTQGDLLKLGLTTDEGKLAARTTEIAHAIVEETCASGGFALVRRTFFPATA